MHHHHHHQLRFNIRFFHTRNIRYDARHQLARQREQTTAYSAAEKKVLGISLKELNLRYNISVINFNE